MLGPAVNRIVPGHPGVISSRLPRGTGRGVGSGVASGAVGGAVRGAVVQGGRSVPGRLLGPVGSPVSGPGGIPVSGRSAHLRLLGGHGHRLEHLGERIVGPRCGECADGDG